MTHGPGDEPDPQRPAGPWATPGTPGSPQSNPYAPGPPYPPPSAPGPYPPQGGPGPYPPPPGGYGFPPPAPRPGIIALRPLGVGDILDGTVKLIRSNPKATLGLSAVVGAVAALPLAIGQAIYLTVIGGMITDPSAPSEAEPIAAVVAQVGGTLLSLALTFVGTTILTGLLTRVLGRAVFGGRITAGEAWRLTRSRVWALLGLAMLLVLIMLVPGLLVPGALLAVGIALENTPLLVAAGLGMLAWFVFVTFVMTRLALSSAALVLEHLSVTEAMRRSWSLVKGDSWRVFGIILLTQIVIGVVSSVVAMPFSVGSTALGFLGGGSLALAAVAAVLVAVGETVSAMLTYPFNAGVFGLLYTDRRMRAEAFDLALQTAAAEPSRTSIDDLWRTTTHPAQPRPAYPTYPTRPLHP